MPVLLLCVAYSCNIILALIQTQGVSVEHESSLHIITTFICNLSAQNWSEILISAEQALICCRACSASHISADGRLFKRHMTQSHTKSQTLYFAHFSAHSIARYGILYIIGISISRTIYWDIYWRLMWHIVDDISLSILLYHSLHRKYCSVLSNVDVEGGDTDTKP